jgi:LuxR family maltose regulon positive regulatory protein
LQIPAAAGSNGWVGPEGSALLNTKLFAPPIRTGWVRRERLNRLFVDAEGVPLTLVSAGAGFGKTSLVAEWVDQSGTPSAWLSLDETDNDPARFWAYVCAALARTLPEVLGALRDPSFVRQDPQTLIGSLINLLSNHSERLQLVLDDLHVVEDERIHESLVFLLRNCPPQLALIVTTRTDPPWPLSRFRANAVICEIRSADLRFTPEETAELLRLAIGRSLGEQECVALQRRTEGWVVGLHMAALSLKGSQDVRRFIREFSGSNRFVLDYLAEEVLSQQDPEITDFMLRTCILRSFTAALCDAVLQREGSTEIIGVLESRNLFLVPLDANRQWYRYHHLLQEYLRARSRSAWIDLEELHRRASVWFEDNDYLEEAIDHALDAGDHVRAATLLELAVETRFTVQRQVRTLDWLQRLPADLVSARPKLSSVKIWAAFVIGRLEEAQSELDRAQAALGGAELTSLEREEAKTQYTIYSAWIAYKSGRVEQCITQASEALERLGETPTPKRGLALLALARGQLYAGQLQAARATCEQVLRSSEPPPDPINVQVALSMSALASSLYGNLHEVSADFVRAMTALGDDRGPPHLAAGLSRLCMGEALRESDELERAEALLREGVAQVQRQLGLPEHVCKGQLSLARVRLARGDEAEARRLQAQAELLLRQVADRGPEFVRLLWPALNYRARLWLELGEFTVLRDWLSGSAKVLASEQCGGWEPLRARLHLLEGDAQAALRRLQDASTGSGTKREEIERRWLEIVARHQLGEQAQAAAVHELAGAASAAGLRRLFFEPPRVERLLEAMLSGEAGNTTPPTSYRLSDVEAADTSRTEIGDASNHGPLEELNDRERAILRLMSAGLSNAEIARELYLSVHTVKWHARNLYAKLGVNSRSRAVAKGREQSLV